MDMNIKGVEKSLVGQMKAAASLSGVTLKDWVVNVLTQAIASKLEVVNEGQGNHNEAGRRGPDKSGVGSPRRDRSGQPVRKLRSKIQHAAVGTLVAGAAMSGLDDIDQEKRQEIDLKDGIIEYQFKGGENGNMRKERGKVESSQVQGGEVQKVQGGSKEDAPGGSKTEGEKASRKSAHDQKTCRVYRCSQCVAAGKKF